MSLLRFLLASMVVMFHLSGINVLSGRLAVMGFYVVSGFLIIRVLDSHYGGSPEGVVRFAVNRFLRLYPLFAALFVLGVALLLTIGDPPLHASLPQEGRLRLVSSWSWSDLTLLPRPEVRDGVFLLLGTSSIIPQSWSIGMELAFYASAIPAAMVGVTRSTPILLAASVAWFLYRIAMAPGWRGYDDLIYKEALSTAMFFWAGAALHVYRHKLSVPSRFYWVAIWCFVALIYGVYGNRYLIQYLESSAPGWKAAMIVINLLMLAVTAVIILAAQNKEEGPAVRRLGDLSYGMYLNHFIVAVVMLQLASVVGLPIFGRYNGGEVSFATTGLVLSTAFAWVTYQAIEKPFESLRGLIRSRRSAKPAVVSVGEGA
jgi:peptidoglycan/LPS O-acetylase OafA/YrhL